MINFRELPQDGEAFEQLIRELLFSYGMAVEWSGRGPDGGRDLICRESLKSLIAPTNRTWLVQCKHFAHANRSVGVDDLDNILDSCAHHSATGYLLACSTQPSSAVVNRLESITANPGNPITAACWDGVALERLLSKPRHWAIAQRFLPVSAGNWLIYATERPNDFVAHYRGYVFHLTNRVGSSMDHQLTSIEHRISDLESLSAKLPEGHFIRPRAVWYDDKNGGYTWYIDYMYPHGTLPIVSEAELATEFRDGWALEDGQIYNWDVEFIQYLPSSDHYDQDHYGYYVRYMPNFLEGVRRDKDNWQRRFAMKDQLEALEQQAIATKDLAFKAMVEAFEKLGFLNIVRAVNSGIEIVPKFERRFVWWDIINTLDHDVSYLFDALLVVEVENEEKFHALLSALPNTAEHYFRVSRVYEYFGQASQGLADKDSATVFDLKLTINRSTMTDLVAARKGFNKYFDAMRAAIEKFSTVQ